MKLYEINEQIENCIDSETGEVLDIEQFESLQLEKAVKQENLALWVKDLKAEAEMIGNEIKSLQDRKQRNEKLAKSVANYLSTTLDGEKMATPKVVVSFRTSKAVETDDDFITWAMSQGGALLSYGKPTANKSAIKEAIERGETIEHAKIVANKNIIIK